MDNHEETTRRGQTRLQRTIATLRAIPPRLADAMRAGHFIILSIAAAVTPWLELAIRFWLAQAFLIGTVRDMMSGSMPAMVGGGSLASLVNDVVATPFGLLVRIVCPGLVLIGLGSRLGALPLLFQILFLQGSIEPVDLLWLFLLVRIVVVGPGIYSFDAFLAHGLDSTAVPGARAAKRAVDFVERRLRPAYRLALRLWVASVPLGLTFAGWKAAESTLPSLTRWLADVPYRTAMMPDLALLAVGVLLALGFATRVCALVLILAIPIAQAGMAVDDRLFWVLLLAVLAIDGPGSVSLDRLFVEWFEKLGRAHPMESRDLPRVVVIGGGFAGVAASRGLRSAPCRITLIDRKNHHLFQPLLYQVATAGLPPTSIAAPIRSLFRGQSNIRTLLADVTGISTQTREVVTSEGRMGYDYLILATGARHGYFGRDDWAGDAPGLKQIEDATEIRRRLLIGFERAEATADPASRARNMTFVIVGAGPTGVELAGAIAELARHGLHRDFRSIDPASARVVLVQSAKRILPTFPETLADDAFAHLSRLGVEVRTGAKVEAVDAHGVIAGGTRIDAGTVLWAAGVVASPAGTWLGCSTDQAGRIVVEADLSVPHHQNVFAVGDTATSRTWNGAPIPGLAPAAKQTGAYVAAVIRARLTGRDQPKPFRYRHAGNLATIGRRAAVADFGFIRLRGALAWWVWGAVHILFLVGGRNRSAVVLEWVWAYLTNRRGSMLITVDDSRRGRD